MLAPCIVDKGEFSRPSINRVEIIAERTPVELSHRSELEGVEPGQGDPAISPIVSPSLTVEIELIDTPVVPQPRDQRR